MYKSICEKCKHKIDETKRTMIVKYQEDGYGMEDWNDKREHTICGKCWDKITKDWD